MPAVPLWRLSLVTCSFAGASPSAPAGGLRAQRTEAVPLFLKLFPCLSCPLAGGGASGTPPCRALAPHPWRTARCAPQKNCATCVCFTQVSAQCRTQEGQVRGTTVREICQGQLSGTSAPLAGTPWCRDEWPLLTRSFPLAVACLLGISVGAVQNTRPD